MSRVESIKEATSLKESSDSESSDVSSAVFDEETNVMTDIPLDSQQDNKRNKYSDIRIAELEKEVKELKKANFDLIHNATQQSSLLHKLCSAHEKRINKLKKKLHNATNFISKLENELESSREWSADLKETTEKYEKEMKKKTEELDSIRMKYHQIELELRSLEVWEHEVERQDQEMGRLREEKRLAELERNRLQEELDETRSKVSQLEMEADTKIHKMEESQHASSFWISLT